jgi:cobalt-precorrin 5A hydrolase
MRIAIITLSPEGAVVAGRIAAELDEASVYLHESVDGHSGTERFSRIVELTERIWDLSHGLVFVAPTGVAVRAVAPLIKHKASDPAVVVVDVGGRYAISLLSGHEGGANDLAMRVGNIIAGEPVITTTTEALKTLIVGVGCRRGMEAEKIVTAVETTLRDAGLALDQVRLLASADIKADEKGLREAADRLGIPLRIVSSDEIRSSARSFTHSRLALEKVNLPAVAEPAALLAGRRTQLLVPRKTYNGVTVAIARESSMW